MVLGLDLIVTLVGLLMYVLSVNAKLQEIGRIMFAFGLLALLLSGDRVVALLHG